MDKPLVNKKFKLEKYPGKGGWTYKTIAGIPPTLRTRGGMVKVKGFIDDHEIKSYNLFPLKNGKYFFPVKAEIRKKIRKEAGDSVKIILYPDADPIEIPGELLECLRDEPKAHTFFFKLTDAQQKQYIDWIYSAKTETTRVDRIANTIDRLCKRLKPYEQQL